MGNIDKPILIVDLDGTLLKNDFFAEIFYSKLISNPFQIFGQFMSKKTWLEVKREYISELEQNEDVVEPLINQQIVNWIRDNKSHFNSTVIVSASPDDFVKSIYHLIKKIHPDLLIESAYGSLINNLKGLQKLDFIKNNWGDNYWYIADSKTDKPIFHAAKGAILVKNGDLKILHGKLHQINATQTLG